MSYLTVVANVLLNILLITVIFRMDAEIMSIAQKNIQTEVYSELTIDKNKKGSANKDTYIAAEVINMSSILEYNPVCVT